MAVSSFSKKLMRTMSADQKADLAGSTNDLDLMFTFMGDKSRSVSDRALHNPLRFTSPAVEREIKMRVENKGVKEGNFGTEGESQLTAYAKKHGEKLDSAGAALLFNALDEQDSLRAYALDVLSSYSSQKFNYYDAYYGGSPLTTIIEESPIRLMLVNRFLPGCKGKDASWLAKHPFLRDLSAVSWVSTVLSLTERLCGEFNTAMRATYLLAETHGKDSEKMHFNLLYTQPDLLRSALKKNRFLTLTKLSEQIYNLKIIRDSPSKEVLDMLLESIREQSEPRFISLFSAVEGLDFTFQELFNSVVKDKERRAIEPLISRFGDVNQEEIKKEFLRKNYSYEASEYLEKLSKKGLLSPQEEAQGLLLYDWHLLPSEKGLADLFAAGAIKPPHLKIIEDLMERNRLTTGHYRVLWAAGIKRINFYLRGEAAEVAIEHFTPDELWEAMRAADLSRRGITQDLRSKLRLLEKKKKKSSKVDEEFEEESDEDHLADDSSSEEDEARIEAYLAECDRLIKKTPLAKLADLIETTDTKEFLDVCHKSLEEAPFSTLGADACWKLFQCLHAQDKKHGADNDWSDILASLLILSPAEKRREFMLENFDDYYTLRTYYYGEKVQWPLLSLSDLVAALAAPGETEQSFRLHTLSHDGRSVVVPDEDLPKVLSLCRSSVETERLLGFRILPSVMARMNAKDVSRAILRSEDANKKLNRFVAEMAMLGDEIGSGVFLLLSYVKELYFDHSSVLAADFMETMLNQKAVSSAILCPPQSLFTFLSLVHKISPNPNYLLTLLADQTKRGSMYAKDAGQGFEAIMMEKKSEAIGLLKSALRGDRVFTQEYDLMTLSGLHDAVSYLGQKYGEENYAFSHDDTPEMMRRLYESPLAYSGITITHGDNDSEIIVKLVRESFELVELGTACAFCIGNGHYAAEARRGDQAHFSLSRPGKGFIGAASFSLPSWDLEQMLYTRNQQVPSHIKGAIVRAVTDYVSSHWDENANALTDQAG